MYGLRHLSDAWLDQVYNLCPIVFVSCISCSLHVASLEAVSVWSLLATL